MEKKNVLIYKVLYSLIIFLSAFLIFMFQPMTGKIVTPQYGGGADIWTSCLVFFQFVLFAGYLLAYLLNKLNPRVNSIIYALLFILALALFNMPHTFGSWLGAKIDNPLIALFASLFKYAFLPVLVLSTVSVSVQNWYTKQTGQSPYILYSISNIGSFLALFLYPLVYEPIMTISSTVKLWHVAFILLVALIVSASVIYFINSKNTKRDEKTDDSRIPIKSYLYWISLSAAGTILLTSYTTYATVRILPMPLLWTQFLGLYLLTFVLCFGSEKFYKKNVVLISIPVLFFINIFTFNATGNISTHPVSSIFITALAFFTLVMLCNGEIYKTRPNPSKLSEFYLSIAFGGVLGGVFVNILAPVIFTNYTELPLINVIMYIFAFYLLIKQVLDKKPLNRVSYLKLAAIAVISMSLFYFYLPAFTGSNSKTITKYARNFYGVSKVQTVKEQKVRIITNGNTIHGAQFYDADKNEFKTTPLTYYVGTSALSYVTEGMRNHQSIKKRPLNIGAIGLGAGTAASYLKKGDKITFYEIDPKMYKSAENDFSYLRESKGTVDVLLGDARIVLNKKTPQKYDILLVDAFSSDAVPVHLVTKEAFDIYKKHIKNDGIILFHISNNYLALERMLKKLTDEEKLESVFFNSIYKHSKNITIYDYYKYNSQYFIVFMPGNKLYKNFKNYNYKKDEYGGKTHVYSEEVKDDIFLKPFTDDYSSLVRVFKFWK